jgi:hypothetical protein
MMGKTNSAGWLGSVFLCLFLLMTRPSFAADPGLVGYWKLQGDSKDYSGQGRHGQNHHADLTTGRFNGKDSFIEVADDPAFRFGTGEFSISAWVFTERDLHDVIGDVLSKYDPVRRRGINLTLNASAAGYNSTSNARYVQFGIDDDRAGTWMDCGRPGGKTHNSDALTAFQGRLYAGTTDAPGEENWAHVFHYKGGQIWEDCGRVGQRKTRGVYALVVHDNALYAATSASHGPQPKSMDFGRVYRYKGGKEWEDIGQPGSNHRLNCLASYKGKLYVCGFNIGSVPGHCYVYEGDKRWRECGQFDGWPHALAVHDAKLYTAYPKGEVFAYDGSRWENLGNPLGSLQECSQIHSLGVFQGELHAGTWPKGKVAVLRKGKWVNRGRLGDATEVIALTVYNGCLYAGTIPRAEVFRFEEEMGWTSVRRFFDPKGFQPVPVGSRDAQGVADWSRATSLTVYGGKLFASTGTCYRTQIDPPRPDEVRGKVYAFQAGATVSHDHDLGDGWKHLVAIRGKQELKLFVNGRLMASAKVVEKPIDVSNNLPLRIGLGQLAPFSGRIREVRLYNRALAEDEIRRLSRVLEDQR